MYTGNHHEYTYASLDGSSTAFHGYAHQAESPPIYPYHAERTNVPPLSSTLHESDEMTVDHLLDNDLQYALVLDTNILMDHLTLLDGLFPQIRHNNLKLALMVPRVVIHELDNLKTNSGSQEKRFKAQNANRWLATQMQPGQRYLRGQKSTKASGTRLFDENNDDLIINYCKEVQQITLPLGGRVTLLTNDHNCRARAQSAGIPTLELKNLTRPLEVLTPCVGSLLKLTEDRSTDASRWASSNSSETSASHPSRSSTAPPRMRYRSPARQPREPTISYHSDPGWMDGEDIDMSPPRPADPLTTLHDEFVETMTTGFRTFVISQAKLHEIPPPSSKLTVRTGGSWDSIHAPTSHVASPLRKQPLPAEVETWTCAECIDHILRESDASTSIATRVRMATHKPDVVLAKQLVSRAGSGGRKGNEWTFGGWKVGLDQLKELAVYCGIEGLEAHVEVWRARVLAAFERGLTGLG